MNKNIKKGGYTKPANTVRNAHSYVPAEADLIAKSFSDEQIVFAFDKCEGTHWWDLGRKFQIQQGAPGKTPTRQRVQTPDLFDGPRIKELQPRNNNRG